MAADSWGIIVEGHRKTLRNNNGDMPDLGPSPPQSDLLQKCRSHGFPARCVVRSPQSPMWIERFWICLLVSISYGSPVGSAEHGMSCLMAFLQRLWLSCKPSVQRRRTSEQRFCSATTLRDLTHSHRVPKPS